MEIRWDSGVEPKIADIKVQVSEKCVALTFKWSNELEHLYIYKQSLLQEETIDWEKPYRKYTKSEYANLGGFKDSNAESALCKYILCPYIQKEDESYIIRYENKCNEIEVIGHRIEIHYEIKERKKILSSRKFVQMRVFCDIPLSKAYLCYVKKKGSIPIDANDGIRFQFIADFEAGDNILPEIEVDKDEYVRVYLTEEVPRKEAYRIIKNQGRSK